MISIVLVTGFLGSGKTTFLRHFDENNQDKKIVFLVNDFSSNDIDYQLLSQENENIISVAGGSIFCKCLVTEFITQLKSIPKKFPSTDIVVIEASGIANPSTFKTMLIETGLNRYFYTEKTITIVDPEKLPILYKTLPNIKNQITLADLVIINKTDIATRDNISNSINIIKELNPFAKIVKTSFCDLDFSPVNLDSIADKNLSPDLSHEPQSEFSRYSYRRKKSIRLTNLNSLISDFQKSMYRIKGYILVDDEPKWVEYDGTTLKIGSASIDKINSLEFIFSSKTASEIRKRINSLGN